MKRTLLRMAAAGALILGLAPAAQAQMQWTDRGFGSISFGAQAPSQTVTTLTTPDIYNEPASFSSTQDVGGGLLFDISAGYKVWRNLAVGVGLSRVASKADLTVEASVPDPLFFDSPRRITATIPDAKHSQTAINLTGTWVMPITDKIDVGYQFGPTIFLVTQDVPGLPTISEPGPTIASLPLESADKTTIGVHFGIDVTYMVTPRFGVGGIARYAVGSADIAGSEDSLTVGGFQIGVGARVRF